MNMFQFFEDIVAKKKCDHFFFEIAWRVLIALFFQEQKLR